MVAADGHESHQPDPNTRSSAKRFRRPRITTLTKRQSSGWVVTNPTTFGWGLGLRSSDRILVSSSHPVTDQRHGSAWPRASAGRQTTGSEGSIDSSWRIQDFSRPDWNIECRVGTRSTSKITSAKSRSARPHPGTGPERGAHEPTDTPPIVLEIKHGSDKRTAPTGKGRGRSSDDRYQPLLLALPVLSATYWLLPLRFSSSNRLPRPLSRAALIWVAA